MVVAVADDSHDLSCYIGSIIRIEFIALITRFEARNIGLS